jgi:hypothetical protein
MVSRAHSDLESGEVDVVVVAARRMSCLYALLREQGLGSPEKGVVTSDRFLELQFNRDWWHGKNVRILDDSWITGRTVNDRIGRISEFVGRHGSVSAEVVVASISVPSDVHFVTEPVKLEREEFSLLHQDFARVMGNSLVPYFTDFVVSNDQQTSSISFEELLQTPNWVTVDVTNSAIAGTRYKTFSLIPRGEFREKITSTLGGLAPLLEICKFRLFVEDSGVDVRFRVVPIISVVPVSSASVQKCANAMKLTGQIERPEQAFGLIICAISVAMLKAFSKVLDTFDINEVLGIDAIFSEINFGDGLTDRIVSASDELRFLDLLEPADSESSPEPVLSQSLRWNQKGIEDGAPLFVLGDDLVDPLYFKIIELSNGTDKKQISEKPKQKVVDIGFESKIQGSNSLTFSLALDVLNDLGYAVPINYVHEGVVSRGFKPGESAGEMPVKGILGGGLASIPITLRVHNRLEIDGSEPISNL